MDTWLDTETKAILQRTPPEKLAPPDTATFALVLLAVQSESRERLIKAVEHVGEVTWADALKLLARPFPTVLKRHLSYGDALLGQFDLVACDAVSIFLADEVVADAPESYLADLYSNVRHSSEFDVVSVRVESVPDDAKGRDFMSRFVGVESAQLPLELNAMKKKARIMEHWAAKIGGRVVVGQA